MLRVSKSILVKVVNSINSCLLKWNLFNFDMLITFCFGVSSNLSQQKSPTAEILRIYFLRTIFRRKYMHKISTVGFFCCDEFEEIPKQKVINMSKLNKFYFKPTFSELRSWPQKIAVVPRSGSRTIRDGMLQ